jgi:hypothetical protein
MRTKLRMRAVRAEAAREDWRLKGTRTSLPLLTRELFVTQSISKRRDRVEIQSR